VGALGSLLLAKAVRQAPAHLECQWPVEASAKKQQQQQQQDQVHMHQVRHADKVPCGFMRALSRTHAASNLLKVTISRARLKLKTVAARDQRLLHRPGQTMQVHCGKPSAVLCCTVQAADCASTSLLLHSRLQL
jgi:hypothetical protein